MVYNTFGDVLEIFSLVLDFNECFGGFIVHSG